VEPKALSDRLTASNLPKIGEIYGYNAACANDEAQLAARRYEYALEQRDKTNERLRFGALTLNAASLFGFISLAGDQSKMSSFGISNNIIGFCSLLFGIGLIFGCLSIWTNANHYTILSAQAFKFRSDANHKSALFEQKIGPEAEKKIEEILQRPAEAAPDFEYSTLTILLTNAAGSLWMTGFGYALATIARRFIAY